jgi:hypothetical protein
VGGWVLERRECGVQRREALAERLEARGVRPVSEQQVAG